MSAGRARRLALAAAGALAGALLAQTDAPMATAPARDPRRTVIRIAGDALTVFVQEDGPGAPVPPEIRLGGRALRLRERSRRTYGGDAPGAETRYEAKLPTGAARRSLEILDPVAQAALALVVAAPRCIAEGTAGRLMVDREGVQAIGEIFPQGSPVRFSLTSTAGDACPAPALPPPPEGGRRNAHLSHAPRHDGVFFMAADGSHHLEMTCGCGRLELYLYDDRVIPLPATGCNARIEGPGGAPLALAPSRDGASLALALPAGAKPPIDLVLRAELAPGLPEERFDFHFPFCDPCPG